MYSLNSRAGRTRERIEFTMECEGIGVFGRFCRKGLEFLGFGWILGKRVIGKGAEYTYRKVGHYVCCRVGRRFWRFAQGLVRDLF